MSYTYQYPRPAVTVDILLFLLINSEVKLLLIQRDKYPFEGKWALPGGFLDMDETLEKAAIRELQEETNIQLESLIQFYTFDAIDRDPRHRTISTVFYTLIKNQEIIPKAASDARNAKFFSINNLPELAFDHKQIIEKAINSLIKNGS